MANEDVKRAGKIVRVEIDGVAREHAYSSVSKAKRAYVDLMFSKVSRQRFIRRPPRGS